LTRTPTRLLSDAQLLADEARYSSFGDTVHYVDPPKIFQRGEGSYMFDGAGVPYLDLQMWYSACNFGYSNKRLNDALKDQIDTLPQVASQYLHRPACSWPRPLPWTCTRSSASTAACTSTSAARRPSKTR
jgi:4-aminobutyrate aminotransferase-like enzyme